MEQIKTILKDVAKMGAISALTEVGLTSGEISQRKAHEVYGRTWIEKMVADGRLHPCRVGDGRTGTKFYLVADILAIKAADAVKAQLQTL